MVGNDVVDLSDPESARGAHHWRFDRRVFTPDELESLSIEREDVDPRWILWSAKEAAYKAARRERADSVFSPRRFVVRLDRSLCGSVEDGLRSWPVRVRMLGDCVHAVVSAGDPSVDTFAETAHLDDAELRDPSLGVRRFAIDSIAERLGISPSDLRIERENRIPALVVAGELTPRPLSLSHHGRFVGFACSALPTHLALRRSTSIASGRSTWAAPHPLEDGACPNLVSRPGAWRSVLS